MTIHFRETFATGVTRVTITHKDGGKEFWNFPSYSHAKHAVSAWLADPYINPSFGGYAASEDGDLAEAA